jgi:hypothetical protein
VKIDGPEGTDIEIEIRMVDADGRPTDDIERMSWGESWILDARGRVLQRDYLMADPDDEEGESSTADTVT